MPAQETVRASFFCAGTAARGGGCLRGGLFMGWSVCGTVCGIVCGAVCLRDGQFAAPESFQGRGQGRNRGTGQGNRETGKRGIGGGSPVGQWSVVGSVGGRFAGRMFPGRGEWPFLRSPKYLRRISCTVRNNPVYLQSAAGLQAGCFRGGANGLFCVRRNIYGGFLAPCAITRYIYKSELKKQTDR